MVLNLCAIITVVTFFWEILSKALWTSFSDLLSKADVASSNINILGLFKMALAIATRCF